MTNPSLSRVTLKTVENYRTAATQAVVAYRHGSERLVGMVNGALEESVYPRAARVAPRVTERVSAVRGNVSEIVVKGITQVADRTTQAIDFGSDVAVAQVQRVAQFADGVQNPLVASGLQTAARLAMPGANVALVLSGKVAEGASRLAEAAGARPVRKAVRKAVAGARKSTAQATRKGKASVKATTARGTKTVKAAGKSATAKVQRGARAARKSVATATA